MALLYWPPHAGLDGNVLSLDFRRMAGL